MKRILCISMFLVIGAVCFAASLTVLVNQRDTSGTTVFENTRLFEDGLINYFFETGSIVSNEPVCLDSEYKGAFQSALDASKTGFIDYVAVFSVSVDAATQSITGVEWNLIHVKSGELLEKGIITAPEMKNTEEMQKGLIKFAEENGAVVFKAMAKKR